jgi:hypothetical protein
MQQNAEPKIPPLWQILRWCIEGISKKIKKPAKASFFVIRGYYTMLCLYPVALKLFQVTLENAEWIVFVARHTQLIRMSEADAELLSSLIREAKLASDQWYSAQG